LQTTAFDDNGNASGVMISADFFTFGQVIFEQQPDGLSTLAPDIYDFDVHKGNPLLTRLRNHETKAGLAYANLRGLVGGTNCSIVFQGKPKVVRLP
jgi:hypothetical protein